LDDKLRAHISFFLQIQVHEVRSVVFGNLESGSELSVDSVPSYRQIQTDYDSQASRTVAEE